MEIIDNPAMSLIAKRDLAHKLTNVDMKATLPIIHEIQKVWNARFNNKSFQSICSLYH